MKQATKNITKDRKTTRLQLNQLAEIATQLACRQCCSAIYKSKADSAHSEYLARFGCNG